MAELVDALVSGTSVSNYVQVRVLFRAQIEASQSNDWEASIVILLPSPASRQVKQKAAGFLRARANASKTKLCVVCLQVRDLLLSVV